MKRDFQKIGCAVALLLMAFVVQGCAVINFPLSLGRTASMQEFVVKPSEHRFESNKILLLDISGFITAQSSGGGLFGESESTIAKLSEALEKAAKDNNIKALIVRIDSPGGTVAASDTLFELIRRFKQKRAEKNRPVPVLASIQGTGASGGYYAALAADKVYIHPAGLTGAIGVVATFPNLSGLTKKIGVDIRVIKSSDKKDLGSIWRDFEPGEREVLQSVVDDLYQRFVRVVSESRQELDFEEAVRLADGRVYTAKQALDKNLVDGIAYLDEVVERAREEAGIKDATVVTYRRAREFEGTVYSHSPAVLGPHTADVSLVEINADGIFGPFRRPGFYYLWLP